VKKYTLDLLAPHQVYRTADGERVPGVTTILGATLPKDALIHWAWKLGTEGKDYKKEREAAANVGTVAHARIEAWLAGLDFDDDCVSGDLLVKSEAPLARFKAWWHERKYRPLLLEAQMVSERFKCGGTLDVLATPEGGGRVADLVDIKTTNATKSWPYDSVLIQVCAYATLVEEGQGAPVRDIHVWRIGKTEDDEGQIYTLSAHEREVATRLFARLCDTYRDLKELGR
jgi:hypothetical protein